MAKVPRGEGYPRMALVQCVSGGENQIERSRYVARYRVVAARGVFCFIVFCSAVRLPSVARLIHLFDSLAPLGNFSLLTLPIYVKNQNPSKILQSTFQCPVSPLSMSSFPRYSSSAYNAIVPATLIHLQRVPPASPPWLVHQSPSPLVDAKCCISRLV